MSFQSTAAFVDRVRGQGEYRFHDNTEVNYHARNNSNRDTRKEAADMRKKGYQAYSDRQESFMIDDSCIKTKNVPTDPDITQYNYYKKIVAGDYTNSFFQDDDGDIFDAIDEFYHSRSKDDYISSCDDLKYHFDELISQIDGDPLHFTPKNILNNILKSYETGEVYTGGFMKRKRRNVLKEIAWAVTHSVLTGTMLTDKKIYSIIPKGEDLKNTVAWNMYILLQDDVPADIKNMFIIDRKGNCLFRSINRKKFAYNASLDEDVVIYVDLTDDQRNKIMQEISDVIKICKNVVSFGMDLASMDDMIPKHISKLCINPDLADTPAKKADIVSEAVAQVRSLEEAYDMFDRYSDKNVSGIRRDKIVEEDTNSSGKEVKENKKVLRTPESRPIPNPNVDTTKAKYVSIDGKCYPVDPNTGKPIMDEQKKPKEEKKQDSVPKIDVSDLETTSPMKMNNVTSGGKRNLRAPESKPIPNPFKEEYDKIKANYKSVNGAYRPAKYVGEGPEPKPVIKKQQPVVNSKKENKPVMEVNNMNVRHPNTDPVSIGKTTYTANEAANLAAVEKAARDLIKAKYSTTPPETTPVNTVPVQQIPNPGNTMMVPTMPNTNCNPGCMNPVYPYNYQFMYDAYGRPCHAVVPNQGFNNQIIPQPQAQKPQFQVVDDNVKSSVGSTAVKPAPMEFTFEEVMSGAVYIEQRKREKAAAEAAAKAAAN